jgi:hypothetical protein
LRLQVVGGGDARAFESGAVPPPGEVFRLATGTGEARFTESGVKEKTSTGLTGLDPCGEWKAALTAAYAAVLEDLRALPQDSYYRQACEATTRYRLSVVALVDDFEVCEREIGCGQVEELLEMAKDERELIAMMRVWRPWEDTHGETDAERAQREAWEAEDKAELEEPKKDEKK